MQALVVEPGDVFNDGQLDLASGGLDAVGDELGLEAVDGALSNGVVQGVADVSDRGESPMILERLRVVV